MYSESFRRKAVSAEDVTSLDDLARLPIVTKETFLGRNVEEFTDNSRILRSAWKTTSGTSGKPFAFLREASLLGREQGVDFDCLRFLLWQGHHLYELRKLKTAQIIVRFGWKKNYLLFTVEELRANPGRVARAISAFGPDVLTSYPSTLLELARYAADDRLAFDIKPRYVVSFGETLSPLTRSFLENTFQSVLYDRYGMGEVGAVGTECAEHDGFHLHSESVIVEIVDNEGNAVSFGETGRVVVTDLTNHAMPFIRYDTGDRGAFRTQLCLCGLRAPRITIDGRHPASTTLGNRRFSHLELSMALDGFMNVLYQYQIVKTSEQTLVVRTIPGPAFNESVAQAMKACLCDIVGRGIDVRVEPVSTIAVTSAGKSLVFLDKTTA